LKQTPYTIAKTVEKAFGLLEALSEKQPLRPTELVHKLGMSRSSVHRLLATLERLGCVEKTIESQYRLGLKIFVLGNSDPFRKKLIEIAHPYMTWLAEISQENVNLALMYGRELLYIDKIESSHYLKLDQPIGKTDPVYCTALGKALLSGMTEQEFRAFCKSTELTRRTKRTITDPDALWTAINKVKRNGYAIDLEELNEGIHCIGAPIRDYNGKVIAAISISAPAVRLTKERIEELRAPLIETSKEISRKMGYVESVEKGIKRGRKEITK
jgi:DNA-binding IclR family transcriptional regulator